MNLDTISFTVTAPGGGPTAAAAVTGDPAAVRNGKADSRILLLAGWCKAQAVGFSQILFPSGHDLVRNIRWRNVANQPDNKLCFGIPQEVRAQDPLTVSQSGSAVAGQIETIHTLWWYEDLPGVAGRLVTTDDIRQRAVDLVTIEDTTTATAGGAYSGARALNAASDLLKANTDYAVLGATIGTVCGALTIRGSDSGNLRASIPGLVGDAQFTNWWFKLLADQFAIPCIPVFNSANKAGIFIENVQDQALTAVPFSLNLVQLTP
jgi:hypothetical protein